MRTISFVIPCYNCENTLTYVIDEIIDLISQHKDTDYQIILINDGSKDNSWDIIKNLSKHNKKILAINLSKNFGQAKARLAALNYIRGEVTVYLDDDGQHPVERVFDLIDKIDEDFDLVFANFNDKKHTIFHRMGSKLNGKLLEINGVKAKNITVSSLFVISSFCVDKLKGYTSPFPSFTSYIMQCTDKVACIPLPHRRRRNGKSGYTIMKLIGQWLTGFTNFSIVPLRLASALGGITAIIGVFYAIYIFICKLLNLVTFAGCESLMAVVLVLGGIIMILLGILGEYIGRIYMTISNTPLYGIREVINDCK